MSTLERYLIGGYGMGSQIEDHRSLSLVTPAALEPIAVLEARTHLRVDNTFDDSKIARLIKTTRGEAEEKIGRRLITSVWNLRMDRFPGLGRNSSAGQRINPWEIIVPFPPLISVASISYVDNNGTTQVFDPANYIVDAPAGENCDPGRIALAYGKTWPSTRPQANAVTIQFSAGYGAQQVSVPSPIIDGMLLLLGHLYVNREAVFAGVGVAAIDMPHNYLDLWAPYRTYACA